VCLEHEDLEKSFKDLDVVDCQGINPVENQD
jgi:hypothetical protein